MCDFELALHGAVREQFDRKDQEVILNGRLFHWKKALRTKMKEKYKIPSFQIKAAMEENVMDILTIIPKDEIITKGIPYVMSIIQEKTRDNGGDIEYDHESWSDFWGYFDRT